jgi:hypothetical protein
MKPIKEYNCSQEKLNPKKFFPVILFLFGFALLLSVSAESQTLKSISGKDTEIRNKISAGFYNSQSNDDIGSFDIKPEFLLDVMGDETRYLLGITLEVELTTSKKASWIISATPLIRTFISNDNSPDYLRLLGLVLTGGRKYYFNESRIRGYFSMNAGLFIGDGFKSAFYPAFGLEYKLSDAIKFETELKATLFFPVFTSAALFPGINAGIGFLF